MDASRRFGAAGLKRAYQYLAEADRTNKLGEVDEEECYPYALAWSESLIQLRELSHDFLTQLLIDDPLMEVVRRT